jgi:hypothetical protein
MVKCLNLTVKSSWALKRPFVLAVGLFCDAYPELFDISQCA